MARILVVDDEPTFRELLRDILEHAGHQVLEAGDGVEALAILEQAQVHMVVTDQRMPRLDGLGLVRRLRAQPAPPPVVVITAHGTIPDAVEAVRLGAADYLTKPLPAPSALLAVVGRLLAGEESGEEFVTGDARVKELLAVVDRVAGRDVAVLITGESGTGKELIARRIHAKSRREGGPFVAVNCAALPESLAESELFGHEKGAFTGADRSRVGRFEEAVGGTLLLDEVGELTLALQAKLLRALEERVIRRVGGGADRTVDVRLVAATNRDLQEAVAGGGFRQDLFFRLAVVPLVLPPLRERPADIPLLARHLLTRLAARHGLSAGELTPEALAALQRHPWPGNVRELRNALERALVVKGGGALEAGDLLLVDGVRDSAGTPSLDREAWEREAVLEALRQAGGNREEAARLLGVSVRTLYYRLRKLRIT